MIVDLREKGVRAIVLDIEGTTTPIAFVYEVLFPYARAHVGEYLRDGMAARDPEFLDLVNLLRQEWATDAAASAAQMPPAATASKRRDEAPPLSAVDSVDALTAYVEWLMAHDRKSTGLKRLQGLVWERGYANGELKGEVFDDVPAAIERWRERGVHVAIYSSGSVLAQRLLFATTPFGDLTRSLSAFFDTTTGAKTSPDSFRTIARALGCSTAELLFISDMGTELDAARSAGCQVVLCVRPGNAPQRVSDGTTVIRTFDDIG